MAVVASGAFQPTLNSPMSSNRIARASVRSRSPRRAPSRLLVVARIPGSLPRTRACRRISRDLPARARAGDTGTVVALWSRGRWPAGRVRRARYPNVRPSGWDPQCTVPLQRIGARYSLHKRVENHPLPVAPLVARARLDPVDVHKLILLCRRGLTYATHSSPRLLSTPSRTAGYRLDPRRRSRRAASPSGTHLWFNQVSSLRICQRFAGRCARPGPWHDLRFTTLRGELVVCARPTRSRILASTAVQVGSACRSAYSVSASRRQPYVRREVSVSSATSSPSSVRSATRPVGRLVRRRAGNQGGGAPLSGRSLSVCPAPIPAADDVRTAARRQPRRGLEHTDRRACRLDANGTLGASSHVHSRHFPGPFTVRRRHRCRLVVVIRELQPETWTDCRSSSPRVAARTGGGRRQSAGGLPGRSRAQRATYAASGRGNGQYQLLGLTYQLTPTRAPTTSMPPVGRRHRVPRPRRPRPRRFIVHLRQSGPAAADHGDSGTSTTLCAVSSEPTEVRSRSRS